MEETSSGKDFHVVGVGASAGGLESLERFFAHLPTDTGMAFVVLQHLSPDFKSLMDELLGRRTTLPILQAEHEMEVKPDTVYLLPSMKEMTIQNRRLLLSDRDPRHGLALPIDHFFRSLAQDAGERAVGVILSGSGSDGSRGVQEIRRLGGVVFAESPDTAKFNGMPLSAIGTGAVDQVLPPEEIAASIAQLRLGQPDPADDTHCDVDGDDLGFNGILRLLRDEYGIDFSHYKASTVTRRIERRLALNRGVDIDTYVEQLRRDPRELNSLYEDLLIGVTRFFRDDEAFASLEQRVIPDIIERSLDRPDEPIRVWVAGCATGEEAYSIAMLLHEQLLARKRLPNVKILATDVHKASLEIASSGLFTEQQVAGMSPERLERFFTRKADGYQVSQALRELIVFAPHNLIRDSPFTKLDLISCRNLLIYFQPQAQRIILTLFHFALRTGGYLYLGSSESPGGLVDDFETIDDHAKIFRKRRDVGLPADLKLPLPRVAAALRTSAAPRPTPMSPQLLSAYDRLLERYMPPSFLVDEHGQLVDSYGGVETLLKVKRRRPTQILLDMLADDFRALVSGALYRVRKDNQSVSYEGVHIQGLSARYSLTAEPLRDPQGAITHVLLSITDADGAAGATPLRLPQAASVRVEPAMRMGEADLSSLSQDRVRVLQDELSYTKENLQATVEELETANEELQSTNEELVASNEELQSTNEELHSVNEELYTVNAEYQKKNAELRALNDDIEHLLVGTDLATLFLDQHLCIRRFTPRIAEMFQVIPHDIGRPITSFVHTLTHTSLIADIERVLKGAPVVEAQTWDKQGRCYFMRILPYHARQAENASGSVTDGVVVTFTDISALEQARARLAELSAIVESTDDAIVGTTLDGIVTSWNGGAVRLYGYEAHEAIGRHATFLSPPGLKEEVDHLIKSVIAGRSIEPQETTRLRKDGSLVDVSITYSAIRNSAGEVVGISKISHDITALVRARNEITEREERIRLLLDSAAEAIYGVDLGGTCTFCNRACARMLGYDSPAALIGRQMHPLILHTRRDGTAYPPEQSPVYEAMRTRKQTHVDGDLLWRADGTSFPAEYWSHPILKGDDVIGAVVTFLDITERRQAEEEVLEGVRRREQFLAMLSHELRNPLAAILSATHILDMSGWGDSACQEAGSVVKRQAGHMTRLLDDLLDVSRITRGRIVLRKEIVDLRETARGAIESLGPLLAEHETQLSVAIGVEPVLVNGDPTRLQQVQANLLSNASKYTPRGGRVHFELRIEGGEAMIRVSDEGRGIEPELIPRIFDLFVQGSQSIARSEGGLGIGLTLLRTLVELHHGRVDVQSDGPGKGSVFTVWLPLADARAATKAVNAPAAAVRTIVLVEDQADARRMLQLLLETNGRVVHTAINGLEGSELIERIRPDLAIVDLGLPVMNGFDLARRIRANSALAGIKLVALSGYGQDADVQAALDAGFDEHLTKPPDPERLEQVLASPVAG